MLSFKYVNNPDFRNVDLKLYYCGSEDCSPSHSWGPGIKDHYKIHYVHSGKGIFQTDGKTYNISQGQLFLIYPNTVSYYAADSNEPWSYSWVAFNGVSVESYLNRASLNKENPILQCSNEDMLIKCFNDMFEGSKASKSSDIKLLGSLYSFLSIIIESSVSPNSISKNKLSETRDLYVKKSIEFIQTNYSRRINVEDIAEHIGISRKYLSKLFSETIAISPQSFLINFRIEKACELMTNPYLSIVEISYSIGYTDPFLFSKVFKKYKGLSPKNYRDKFIHF